jgi:hypothetical protein
MENFPSSYDTLNLYVQPVLYPVSNKHSICIFKLKFKKMNADTYMIFSIRPSSCPVHPQPDEHNAHLMSSTVSPLSFLQPITFFLPATLTRVAFHAVGSCAALHTPLPSCSSSLSLPSCSSNLSHDFLYFFLR